MKKMFMLLSIVLGVSSAYASDKELETFRCKQDDTKGPRYILKVEELKVLDTDIEISEEEYYDYFYLVKVTVSWQDRSGRTRVIRQFKTKSQSEDVHYGIDDKKMGFGFKVYLDELDSGARMYINGKEISLSCRGNYS